MKIYTPTEIKDDLWVNGINPFFKLGPGGGTAFATLDMTTGHLEIDVGNGSTYTGYKIKLANNVVVLGGVGSPLIPDSHDAYNIGSSSRSWAGLYLGPDEILYFNNVPVLFQGVGGGDTNISSPSGKKIRLTQPSFGFSAILDITGLSGSNKTFTFPNTSGTLALLSDITGGSGLTKTVINTSGSLTLAAVANKWYTYFVTGAHTLSMPAAAGNTNRYTVKNTHSANITIDTAGAENIEGAASISIAPGESVDIESDDTNWWIV